MSDIGLTWDPAELAADLTFTGSDLAADDGLETAVLLSLFTDRLADPGDVVPDSATDRRGWWADAFPVVAGDRFGSKLWLLERSKRTPDVLKRAQDYMREALQWLIDDKVCDAFDVLAEFPTRDRLDLQVTIYRPGQDAVKYRYQNIWAAQAAKV